MKHEIYLAAWYSKSPDAGSKFIDYYKNLISGEIDRAMYDYAKCRHVKALFNMVSFYRGMR